MLIFFCFYLLQILTGQSLKGIYFDNKKNIHMLDKETSVFGLCMVRILPPPDMYNPILSYRNIKDKSCAGLCQKCMDAETMTGRSIIL